MEDSKKAYDKMIKLAPNLGEDGCEAMSKFPHIVEKLELYWGFPECAEYLHSLMLDRPSTNAVIVNRKNEKISSDRRKNRQGFPASTWFAINNLIKLHDELFPQHKLEKTAGFVCGA